MIAISYRREDSLPIAGRLYDRLQAKFGKRNVFMDFDSIPAGVDFRDQIKQTIERAHLVIAVIGPDWLGEQGGSRRIDDPADFVRLEIAYALNRGIPVIPLLVDETPMPKAEKLPPDIQALAYRNALPLDSGIDFHSHTDRLIVGIRRALSGARPRTQTNVSDAGQPASWRDRRRTTAIWSGSILVFALITFFLWHFIASRSAEREEREQTLKNDKALAATATPHSSPSPSPPPITPEQSKSIPAQLPEAQTSRTPQPATTTAPTPEPTLESRLIGKWQGPRHMIEYSPDHTFAQTGLKVDGMTWRLEGHNLTVVYPDLGKDTPAWYPGAVVVVLKIVSLGADKLITENEKGLRFVEYRITVDTPDEREGAAARAKAETKKLQPKQVEEPSQSLAPKPTPTQTIEPYAAPTASPADAPKSTASQASRLSRVHIAAIGMDVLLPIDLFPDAVVRFADGKTNRIFSPTECAGLGFDASRDSVKTVYERYLKEMASVGTHKIDYKVLRDAWFVLSGSTPITGFYIKGTKHGEGVAIMDLEYKGSLCNIPTAVLAEMSQKFDGTSNSGDERNKVSQLAKPTPTAGPEKPGAHKLARVFVRRFKCSVTLPTDIFPDWAKLNGQWEDSIKSKDGSITIVFSDSPEQLAQAYGGWAAETVIQGKVYKKVNYKILKDSWFVVSGTYGDNDESGWYVKGVKGGTSFVKGQPGVILMRILYDENLPFVATEAFAALTRSFDGK